MMPGDPLDLKTALEFPCGKEAGVDLVSRLRRFSSRVGLRVATSACSEKATEEKSGRSRS